MSSGFSSASWIGVHADDHLVAWRRPRAGRRRPPRRSRGGRTRGRWPAACRPARRSARSTCGPRRCICRGERLDEVAAAQRIDRVGHARLVGQHLLRAQGQRDGMFRGQRQRLVHAVGVQRLAAAQHRGQRLVGHANQVHLGLLVLQRAAGRLGVEPQLPGAFALRAVVVPQPVGPQRAGRAVLGDFLEQVVVRVEEEAQPRGELVDRQPAGQASRRRSGTRRPA